MNQSSNPGDVYDIVTSHFIKQLFSGTIPWRITWTGNGQPQNMHTRNKYRGVNIWSLLGHGFAQNLFLSETQVKQLGGSIRPSEPGYPIIYWKTLEGQEKPSIQSLLVYNIDQCKGIPEDKIPELEVEKKDPIKKCQDLIVQMPNPPSILHEEADTLYYHPELDFINIPPMEKFESPELYYKMLFNELVRSVFHASRLKKTEIEIKQFNAVPFTLESLVAEMGATYLASWAGLDGPIIDADSSYKEAWVGALRADKYILIKAGTLAQKAVDYILSGESKEEAKQSEEVSTTTNQVDELKTTHLGDHEEKEKKRTARKKKS
jgi:antirestriction protein ArdC